MGSSTILRYQDTQFEQSLIFWIDPSIFRVPCTAYLDVRALNALLTRRAKDIVICPSHLSMHSSASVSILLQVILRWNLGAARRRPYFA